MNLDGFTLMAAGSFVAALSGLLLLVAWTQIRAPALLWWSAASGIYAFGIGILAFGITSGSTIAVAIASGVTTLTPVLVFGGVRHFNHRPNRLLLLAAGPAVWAAAGAIPFPGGPEFPATVASFAIWVVYLGAAVESFGADVLSLCPPAGRSPVSLPSMASCSSLAYSTCSPSTSPAK